MESVPEEFVFPGNLFDLLARLNASGIAGDEEAIAYLRSLLGSGIISRCERRGDAENKLHRVILTAHDRFADHSRELTKQCNGLVLAFDTGIWRVVSMPPSGFNQQFSIKKLGNDANDSRSPKYTVYDVRDGTIVTLYWYNNAEGVPTACLSTTNGYDVSNHCRVGDTTYMQAMLNAAAAYPKFNIDALDKTRSYTLGFRDARYHPLVDAKLPNLWLVQITDLSSGMPIMITIDIGIPLQLPVTINSARSLSQTITELSDASVDKYLRTGQAHYGYIFRSRTGGNDYIVKSRLLRKLEVLFYDNPKHARGKTATATEILTPARHEKYFALKAFLRYDDRDLYVKLFPQHAHFHTAFTKIFSELTTRVVFLLKSGKHKEVISTSTTNPAIDAVASVMVTHIESTNAINIMDEDSRKIIEDFILSPTYLDWYFTCLCEPGILPQASGAI